MEEMEALRERRGFERKKKKSGRRAKRQMEDLAAATQLSLSLHQSDDNDLTSALKPPPRGNPINIPDYVAAPSLCFSKSILNERLNLFLDTTYTVIVSGDSSAYTLLTRCSISLSFF